LKRLSIAFKLLNFLLNLAISIKLKTNKWELSCCVSHYYSLLLPMYCNQSSWLWSTSDHFI